jgi:hypothetical protein
MTEKQSAILPSAAFLHLAVELACERIRRRHKPKPCVVQHRLLPFTLMPRLSTTG